MAVKRDGEKYLGAELRVPLSEDPAGHLVRAVVYQQIHSQNLHVGFCLAARGRETL